MENAGFTPDVVWNKVREKVKRKNPVNTIEDMKWGYDARNEKVVDMFEAGVIDPVRVTRVALEKAASVAGTMLLTECIITNQPTDNNEPDLGTGGFGIHIIRRIKMGKEIKMENNFTNALKGMTPSDLPDVVCNECKNPTFRQVVLLKKVSAALSPNGKYKFFTNAGI